MTANEFGDERKKPSENAGQESSAAQGATDPQQDSPQDNGKQKEYEPFFALPLRSASQLMDVLYRDDSFYESATFAWVGSQDAKRLFLYGVCKQVAKTCVSMLEDMEHVREDPDKEPPDRVAKLVLGAFIDAQTQITRKMIELLCVVLLFQKRATRDEEYRVFLNAENLDLALGRLEDFRELYDGRVIGNTLHSVNGYAERIRNDLQELGVDTLWFLDDRKLRNLPPERLAMLRPSVFASKRRLYLQALEVASPDQRFALGVSYGRGYSQSSQAVHPLIGSHDYGTRENDPRHIRTNFVFLGVTCMHIMHAAHGLAGVHDTGGIERIVGKDFERSKASTLLRSYQKEFFVGDLVLTAWTDIAEIIDVQDGKYGYRAFHLKYISRPPLMETPTDWMESSAILLRLMPKAAVRTFLEQAAQDPTHPPEMHLIFSEVLKQPDGVLLDHVAATFLQLHNAGLLIPMLIQSGTLRRAESES